MQVEEERIPSGIPGLDGLIQGGFRPGDFILVLGGIGAGKTIFSTEFAYHGAKNLGQPAVLATFEEDIRSVKKNMLKFGMDLGRLESQGKMTLLDLDALEGRGMGTNMETIAAAVDKLKAKRLVVDSLTAFLSGASGKLFDYTFLMHLIYKTLKREGVTTMMTVSKMQSTEGNQVGIEGFVADGVFELENYLATNMELRNRLIIRKLRGTDHSRKYHPVYFSNSGIGVVSTAFEKRDLV